MMPDERLEALRHLCQALLPEDPSLAEEVVLASTDAPAYYARFQERLLDERGIEAQHVPYPDLPWLALLDGLRHRQRLEEFDWKESADAVMEGIDTLLHDPETAAQRWDWVDVEYWGRQPTEDFLQAVGDWLLRHDRMLAESYEDSDLYPVMIIEPSQLPELQRLARLTGYGDVQPLASTLPQDFQLP